MANPINHFSPAADNTPKRYLGGLIFLFLKMLSHFPSQGFRKFILRKVFRAKLHPKCTIYGGVEIRHPWKIELAEGASIGHDSILAAQCGIRIGANANVSSQVMLWSAQHDHRARGFETYGGEITVGAYAWLGPRVIVLPGVIIGEGAVVAAGAVVTKDVEPYAIYGGIPARKIGERTRDLDYTLWGKELPFI